MTQGRRKREASIRLIQDQAVPNPSGTENRQCQVQVLLRLGGSAESRWHRISESGSAALTQAAPSPGGASADSLPRSERCPVSKSAVLIQAARRH